MFGLTHLELVESIAGAFYCYSLGFKTESWLAENLSAPATPSTIYLTQLSGILCLGLRLNIHATRASGVKELFGLNMNWWVALVWGMCTYLNFTNGDIMTDAGQMNTYVCGTFAAAFSLAALGVIKLKAE